MLHRSALAFIAAVSFGLAILPALAGPPAKQPGTESSLVHEASDEGQSAIDHFKIAPGFKVSLFAAEPHLANPVAICTDEKGRWYVAETFRLHKGVTDIRKIMSWLDDDLACKTVEDRITMHRKHEG